MACFNSAVRQIFKERDLDPLADELEEFFEQLTKRRVSSIDYSDLNLRVQAAANCASLRQVMLHRAQKLMLSSGTMLLDGNVYGLGLVVRSHFEATGMLGYFCHRLESLAAGNINLEDFSFNVADAIMGAKHEAFKSARAPLNVLTCIEKADKFFDKHAKRGKLGILMDCYNWLSEYTHPNFVSNSSAFVMDRPTRKLLIRHDSGLQESDFQLPQYLAMSCKVFVFFFDEFEKMTAKTLARVSF